MICEEARDDRKETKTSLLFMTNPLMLIGTNKLCLFVCQRQNESKTECD